MVQLDGERWSKKARETVMEVLREAARWWLLQVSSKIPRDTGFVLGAFEPLAELLNISIVNGGAVKAGGHGPNYGQLRRESLTIHSKTRRTHGEAYLLDKLFKDKQRFEQARRFLKKHKERTSQSKRKKVSNDQAADLAGRISKENSHLDIKEKEQRQNIAYYRSKLYKKKLTSNRRAYSGLKERIARSEDALSRIQKRRVRFASQMRLVYGSRARYRTFKEEISLSQKERMDYFKKNKKFPEKQFTTRREKIRAGDAETIRPLYYKHYYPRAGEKGPIKNPESGRPYATRPTQVFQEAEDTGTFKGKMFEDFSSGKLDFAATLPTGAFSGKPARESISASGEIIPASKNKAVFMFTYDVNITYYRSNDQRRMTFKNGRPIPGTPWLSQVYAQKIFTDYLKQTLPKRLPIYTDYLVKSKATLTNTALRTTKFTRGAK